MKDFRKHMMAAGGATPRRGRTRLAIILSLAVASGCATRAYEMRSSAPSSAPRTVLAGLASDVPSIDAGLGRTPVPEPRPAVVPERSTSPGVYPGDVSIQPASGSSSGGEAGDPTPDPGEVSGVDAAVASSPAALTPPSIPEASPPHPIDLSTALRLADGQNPVIGQARVRILEALAQRTAARSLLLPSLNAGANYRDHVGVYQRSTGAILPVTSQSFYYGGGAGAIGTNPASISAVNIFSPLADAIFEPLAAQQRVVATRSDAAATANTTLLDVASLYIELVGNEEILSVRRELAAEADRIASEVTAYADAGQGRRSDGGRAESTRRLFQAAIQLAEEEVAVNSARLAERLNLDPSSRLEPLAGPLVPISLIDDQVPTELLIRSAIALRPDLAARDASAMQAQYQFHKEKARPLLPTIWLGYSAGVFGGGSNLAPYDLSNFAGRTDFDIRAYWTLLNLGAGNASLIKQRKAQFNQARAERMRVMNQVRDEVAGARADSLSFRKRVDVARQGLRTAEDGYQRDQARLRETVGRPIEALDSLRLLADARVALVRSIMGANRAQFALFVSLGAPPPLDAPDAGSEAPASAH